MSAFLLVSSRIIICSIPIAFALMSKRRRKRYFLSIDTKKAPLPK